MTPQARSQRRAVAFLGSAILLLLGSIFAVGSTDGLLVRKVILKTSFDQVGGLDVGAPVRLAGLDIGVVQHVRFDRDLASKKVHVTLSIQARYLDRIRADSVARLASKGLLGDTLIDITVGSADAPALAAGGDLRSEEAGGLGEAVGSVKEAVGSVQHRLERLLSDDTAGDVGRLAHAGADVLERVEKGPGLAHTLLYDPAEPQRLDALVASAERIVASADHLAAQADTAATRLDRLLATVEQQPGTLHGLIYEDRAGAALADLQRVAHELSEARAGQTLTELGAFARTLRRLGSEVEAGHGTVGALLRYPSIYEDLKLLLGNVERNALLKTLVRYTIRKDGLRDEPEPAPRRVANRLGPID